MACPARFERATYGLEGRCSIQLSYGQRAENIEEKRNVDESGCDGIAFLSMPQLGRLLFRAILRETIPSYNESGAVLSAPLPLVLVGARRFERPTT